MVKILTIVLVVIFLYSAAIGIAAACLKEMKLWRRVIMVMWKTTREQQVMTGFFIVIAPVTLVITAIMLVIFISYLLASEAILSVKKET